MKTRSLFISYRSSDAAKVDKIARDLTLLKYDDGTPRFTTWQDKHNLPPASPNWWDAIVDAIEQCEMFVFNLSRASLQSEVCRAELEYAHKRNRPIIPVVLDEEFILNPGSGKYDLPKETWALVPDWLGQAQFLFYVETQFYGKFQEAVSVFERAWPRDIPAPRPLNPDSKSVHGSNHALYSAACDYAERLAFTDAEKHFDVLVRRNDADYADLAAQWLNLIRRYAELIEIVEHRSPVVIFNKKWTAYQGLFPNDLVDGIFDPKGFAARAAATPPPAPQPTRSRPNGMLPAPFAWIPIPTGKVTLVPDETDKKASYLKRDTTFDVPAFQIGKYPLTNAQFRLFVDEGGYKNDDWWTPDGLEARRQGIQWDWTGSEWKKTVTGEPWVEPRYWRESKWNQPDCPIVGVSWYEAIAYCQWLREVTGEAIRLPTEQEWQRAAQGDDGRDYPWGKTWDGNRCNNSVGRDWQKNSTSPVPQFAGKGDSPFGVVDMAGNVWEWCLTAYESGRNELIGTDRRVLRGGSWYVNNTDYFRCAYRDRDLPDYRHNYRGFRLALS